MNVKDIEKAFKSVKEVEISDCRWKKSFWIWIIFLVCYYIKSFRWKIRLFWVGKLLFAMPQTVLVGA